MATALIICLVIHLGYYILIFSRIALYSAEYGGDVNKDCSIVICYKDEAGNVDEYLPSVVQQKANDFVLVDDLSADDTFELLSKYQSDKIHIIQSQINRPGKKAAQKDGIENAKYDRIILTDADCQPASDKWATILNSIDADFVLGYAPMRKKSSAVAMFSQYETYITGMQYLSYALVGMPYMGVGRNMLINKQKVQQGRDKIKGSHLPSGDDDLMINSLANKDNTAICIAPEAFVYSAPKTDIKSYIRQKARHITTSVHYKWLHKILLGLFSLSQMGFYFLFVVGLVAGTLGWKVALICLAMKWGVQQAINFPVMKKLGEGHLFWRFPIFDIAMAIYYGMMPILIFISKKEKTWN